MFVAERTPHMAAVLEAEVKATLVSTMHVIAELRSGKFDDASEPTDKVVALLASTTAEYEAVAERATRFKVRIVCGLMHLVMEKQLSL